MEQNNQQKPQDSKETPSQSLKTTIAQSSGGEPLLGNLIYWSFSKLRVPHASFSKMMAEVGIDSTKFAPAPRFKSAVHKGLNQYTQNSLNANKLAQFSRKVVDDSKVAAFAVVDSQVDVSNLDMAFNTSLKIKIDKENDNKLFIEGNAEDAARLTQYIGEFKETYTTEQVRASVLKYIYEECGGVSLRENGGIYFIPLTKNEEFSKLQKLFAALNQHAASECSVDTIPVVNRIESAKAMWKALVADARGAMDEMKKDLADVGKVSAKMQESRMAKYRALKDNIEMYEVLLNGTATDLKSELQHIETAFLAKLTE